MQNEWELADVLQDRTESLVKTMKYMQTTLRPKGEPDGK